MFPDMVMHAAWKEEQALRLHRILLRGKMDHTCCYKDVATTAHLSSCFRTSMRWATGDSLGTPNAQILRGAAFIIAS